ncbi:Ger(x)C family spore germination protein [Aneurinibacillus sp. Ricciae_BoGa-3]|uniref:Ger(x)C family spore germination protein n=1 Tax=Aneurinibacillus sp. Ricciae_BoGa-3 TaxID=3022697 RepID=UPI00234027BC|nr:Ger(x)C family spore germination protein [Aneurinibacillus sp. Ricciae_BoGa-3]WCK53959.1 Ger(x)C family spore germination protein [Aneurinibacillus sp. Ricciae_BoGa-3]
MKRKWIFIGLCCLLILTAITEYGSAQSGNPVRELNELNIVMTTGIDYNPNTKKFTLTIQSLKPGRSKGTALSEDNIFVASMDGPTIMEAARTMRSKTSGKLIWYHSKSIVLGRRLIDSNKLKEVVDFFARNREIRYSSWVLIAQKDAKDILNAKPISEVTIGDEILGIINNQSEWSRTAVLTLREMINRFNDPTSAFITGRVVQTPTKDRKNKQIAIEGAVVIHNAKYAMDLTGNEVRTLRLINKITPQEPEVLYSIEEDTKADAPENNTAVQVKIRDRTENVTIKNNLPAIRLKVTIEGTIMETGTEKNLMSKQATDELKRKVSNKAQEEVLSLTKKSKEANVDIFAFGSLIHRKQKDYWNANKTQYGSIYPRMPVNVSFEWRVIRNGMINQLGAGEAR